MSTLFNLTYFSFLFCALAAFLAVFYFITQIRGLRPPLRLLAYLNILICSASCALHAYYSLSLQPLVGGGAATAELVTALADFPLGLRYGYWLTTTVMLIIMFPLLMGVKRVGLGFVFNLALADAGMIVAGYFGERLRLESGALTVVELRWFALGMVLWVYMLVSIFVALRRLPSRELVPVQRDTLGYMYFFILLGWTIYPAGYFYTIVFGPGVGVVLREFTFNLGDIVNKIIWGLMVIYAAREISRGTGDRPAGEPAA